MTSHWFCFYFQVFRFYQYPFLKFVLLVAFMTLKFVSFHYNSMIRVQLSACCDNFFFLSCVLSTDFLPWELTLGIGSTPNQFSSTNFHRHRISIQSGRFHAQTPGNSIFLKCFVPYILMKTLHRAVRVLFVLTKNLKEKNIICLPKMQI